MNIPYDELDAFPAMTSEQITPTGVSLVTLVNDNLSFNFRLDHIAPLDLPSLWRLAKHVVYERGPLFIFRYKDPTL